MFSVVAFVFRYCHTHTHSNTLARWIDWNKKWKRRINNTKKGKQNRQNEWSWRVNEWDETRWRRENKQKKTRYQRWNNHHLLRKEIEMKILWYGIWVYNQERWKYPTLRPHFPPSDLRDWISSPVKRLTQYLGFKSQLCKWRKKKRMAERQRKMWDTQMQHLISVIIQETPPSQPTEDRRRCKRRRETKRRKQKIQPLFAVNYSNMIFRWCRCRCWMLMMTLLIINEWSLLLFH